MVIIGGGASAVEALEYASVCVILLIIRSSCRDIAIYGTPSSFQVVIVVADCLLMT